MRGRHPPQETPTPHPPVTSESRVWDCMNLTVRQFLTLLSDSRRATQRSEAANTATNDVGMMMMMMIWALGRLRLLDHMAPITSELTGVRRLLSGFKTTGKD